MWSIPRIRTASVFPGNRHLGQKHWFRRTVWETQSFLGRAAVNPIPRPATTVASGQVSSATGGNPDHGRPLSPEHGREIPRLSARIPPGIKAQASRASSHQFIQDQLHTFSPTLPSLETPSQLHPRYKPHPLIYTKNLLEQKALTFFNNIRF